MKRLILLNGPMDCGKSHAVKIVNQQHNGMLVERQCKDKLHEITKSLFGVHDERYYEIYETRKLKEAPQPEFNLQPAAYNKLSDYMKYEEGHVNVAKNISIREAMIYVSEIVCKPTFGQEYFGEARIRSMENNETAIDDSTGFVDELYPAVRMLGQENILLVRVRGRGNFDGDSRNYIPDGVINNVVDIDNSENSQFGLKKFEESVKLVVGSFVNAPKEIERNRLKDSRGKAQGMEVGM